jgi:hypothetical protein
MAQTVKELPFEDAVVEAAKINHKMDNVLSGSTPWDKEMYENEARALLTECGENYLYEEHDDVPHIKVNE